MAAIFNVNNTTFTQKQSPVSEFAWHTSGRLADAAGSRQLFFDIRSLDPGKYSKTREKWEQLAKGDSSR
ncbi:hypothetical protein NST84_12060 [Paenibacillus sp. FSL R7-0345]|uniref:hypothetical protein n=1 Tax=Paenibacillus sp. FSL R7-0345 TaxID=2954535 RepID=UPI00315ABCBE